jgi:hypothetical protein
MAQKGENKEILWIGRTEADPYWNCCAGDLPLREFETIYDAMAEVLTGLNAGILVANALIIGPELNLGVKTLLSNGLLEAIFIYTTMPRIPHYTPNGDSRVIFVDRPELLRDRLQNFLRVPEVEVPMPKVVEERPELPVAAKPAPAWPAQPPSGVPETKQPVEKAEEAEEAKPAEAAPPVPKAQETPACPEKQFQAAELTQEELQALLGVELKTEKEP